MFKKAPLVVILFLILILGLSSCNSLPTCGPGNLPMPNLLSPDWGGVFAIGTDNLSWKFPYTTCEPEGYIIELSDEPNFVNTTLNATLSSPDTEINPGPNLQPATKYYWQVSSYVGATVGPASISRYFYTEPVCGYGALAAPDLIFPVDGSVVTTLNPEFDWSYPDPSCFPNGYYFRVSEDPGMGTFAIESDNPDNWSDDIFFGYPLNDCTTYYYQVTPYVNGVAGPVSEINKFVINTTGNCECDPAVLPVPVPLTPSPYGAGDRVIVPVHMQVGWENPGPCTPEGYEIELDSDFYYSDSPYNGQISGGEITTYSPPTLEPATQYWWHVYSSYQGALSTTSTYATFFTEPECTSSFELTAPVILYPAHGAFVNTATPMFKTVVEPQGCVPHTFLIELDIVPSFQNPILELQAGFTTTVIGPTDPLENCKTHYVRAAAVQDGTIGPYSAPHRFFVNDQGSCFPSPIGKANQNVFCNIGPDWDMGIHLFKKDDWIQAVNRNSDTTYLEVFVPDETGKKPADPQITCWIPVGAFTPDETIDLSELIINYPPEPPEEPKPPGDESPGGGGLVCHSSLPAEQCKLAGGSVLGFPYPPCVCPP